jgi:hypothetical protein
MTKRILIAGVVGGIVMFVWGAVSHMVLPIGEMGLDSLPNEDALMSAMKSSIPGAGMYFFPGMDMHEEMSKEEEAAWTAKYKAGPTGLVVYHPGGEDALAPTMLVKELLSNVACALIAASIVSSAGGAFGKRVKIVAMLGLFAWFSISVSHWIWYRFPAAYAVGELLDQAIGWTLAGLAIAKIVKPSSPAGAMSRAAA